ncbi:MAG: hypothetical protein ACFE9I_06650 [Candidatus Hermodarchaeota archaeon]
MEYNSTSIVKEFTKNQKIVALVFYILVVCASLITIGGVVWTFADIFIGTTGKWDMFLELNLGYQIAVIGGLLAGLFFLLIFFFGLFKKTSKSLINFIYRKREIEEKYKNRIDVKIAAGGLLISLIGIIIGIIFAVVLDIFSVSVGESSVLLDFLGSWGPRVLFIGIGLFLIVGVALFMIYFWKNGNYTILRLIGAIEKEKKK